MKESLKSPGLRKRLEAATEGSAVGVNLLQASWALTSSHISGKEGPVGLAWSLLTSWSREGNALYWRETAYKEK